MATQPIQKKVVSRNVVIALGIICIVLAVVNQTVFSTYVHIFFCPIELQTMFFHQVQEGVQPFIMIS